MIGFFDSGVGGLSVLTRVRKLLPKANLVYLADRAHSPYGDRELAEVRELAGAATAALVDRGCRMIAIACNTASAAALHWLRAGHPDLPLVGMEPAVKPAAGRSQSRVVGVLATSATFQGELFASVVDRFAAGIRVLPMACPGLADAVERGTLEDPATARLVEGYVRPLVEQGADTLVLACTHYPYLTSLIRRAAGPGVEVVDPTQSVARQVAKVANAAGLADGQGRLTFLVTGTLDGVAALVERLSGLVVDPQGLP